MTRTRAEIRWGTLVAVEPTLDEAVVHAASLAAAYNEPNNAHMLGHTEALSAVDVVELYDEMFDDGDHPFLLFDAGVLAGDGDLRNIRNGAAELAFLIAAPSAQGKGLGTRFALAILAFGFARLGLARIYASVAPHNAASSRVFEKLGFVVDADEIARTYADEPDDIVFAIDRGTFERVHAGALAEIAIADRD